MGLNFRTILGIVQTAVSAGPAFEALFQQVLPLFSKQEQDELKSAYAKAREGSDDAQDDFVNAGRGN